jgi:hypothetical protein
MPHGHGPFAILELLGKVASCFDLSSISLLQEMHPGLTPQAVSVFRMSPTEGPQP